MTAKYTKPRFFASGAAFREWLERNHDRVTELLLGFYKVKAKKKGITFPQYLVLLHVKGTPGRSWALADRT